jgi:hypothetical protein
MAVISGSAGFVITEVSCTNGTVTPGSDGNVASNAGFLPVIGAISWT